VARLASVSLRDDCIGYWCGSWTRWPLTPYTFLNAPVVPRLCSLADALTRSRFSRLGLAERSAARAEIRVNRCFSFQGNAFKTTTAVKDYARKLPGSLLRFTPRADERSTLASSSCLSSAAFLCYSMSSPQLSWCGCWWCLLPPLSTALHLVVLSVRLDVSWSQALEIRGSGTWLAKPPGLSRTTPLECLSRSTAGSVFSGPRGFGQLRTPRNFAGNRWALQNNASWNHKPIDLSFLTPGPAQLARAHLLRKASWCCPLQVQSPWILFDPFVLCPRLLT